MLPTPCGPCSRTEEMNDRGSAASLRNEKEVVLELSYTGALLSAVRAPEASAQRPPPSPLRGAADHPPRSRSPARRLLDRRPRRRPTPNLARRAPPPPSPRTECPRRRRRHWQRSGRGAGSRPRRGRARQSRSGRRASRCRGRAGSPAGVRRGLRRTRFQSASRLRLGGASERVHPLPSRTTQPRRYTQSTNVRRASLNPRGKQRWRRRLHARGGANRHALIVPS